MSLIKRKQLIEEMKSLIQPGFKSDKNISYIEKRGAEIITKLIDDDILKSLIDSTKRSENLGI